MTQIFTGLAIGIGLFSLLIGFQSSCTLKEVRESMIKIGRTAEVSWTLANVSSEKAWPDYKTLAKKEAAYSKPAYMVLDAIGKYNLTKEGEALLDAKLREDIARIVKENKDIPANDLILKLGIRELYNKARDNNISLEIMIAVITVHVGQ